MTNSDVRPAPEVAIEAKVLGIPASALSQLGLVLPESAPGGGPTGFAVVLPEGEARTLTEDTRTKPVHSLQLKGSSGNVLKFRVDTRALANPNSPAENPPYFEVGMAFEVTPSVISKPEDRPVYDLGRTGSQGPRGGWAGSTAFRDTAD